MKVAIYIIFFQKLKDLGSIFGSDIGEMPAEKLIFMSKFFLK